MRDHRFFGSGTPTGWSHAVHRAASVREMPTSTASMYRHVRPNGETLHPQPQAFDLIAHTTDPKNMVRASMKVPSVKFWPRACPITSKSVAVAVVGPTRHCLYFNQPQNAITTIWTSADPPLPWRSEDLDIGLAAGPSRRRQFLDAVHTLTDGRARAGGAACSRVRGLARNSYDSWLATRMG